VDVAALVEVFFFDLDGVAADADAALLLIADDDDDSV